MLAELSHSQSKLIDSKHENSKLSKEMQRLEEENRQLKKSLADQEKESEEKFKNFESKIKVRWLIFGLVKYRFGLIPV